MWNCELFVWNLWASAIVLNGCWLAPTLALETISFLHMHLISLMVKFYSKSQLGDLFCIKTNQETAFVAWWWRFFVWGFFGVRLFLVRLLLQGFFGEAFVARLFFVRLTGDGVAAYCFPFHNWCRSKAPSLSVFIWNTLKHICLKYILQKKRKQIRLLWHWDFIYQRVLIVFSIWS